MITHTLGLYKCSESEAESYIKASCYKAYNTSGAVKFRKVSAVTLAEKTVKRVKFYHMVS